MNQMAPLPTLWDKLLDPETLEQYFNDLATYAQIISLQEKQSPDEYVRENTISLLEAHEKVISGSVRAIQIRYRFEQQEWCDTLIRQKSGVKLVRMAQ